jgi:ubiquinone/menaquinone biosynthesis C-methylase UbiE
VADNSNVHVVNIDVCENVIEQMIEREKEKAQTTEKKKGKGGKNKGQQTRMTYVVMDACKMTYEDASFDMIIDKVR